MEHLLRLLIIVLFLRVTLPSYAYTGPLHSLSNSNPFSETVVFIVIDSGPHIRGNVGQGLKWIVRLILASHVTATVKVVSCSNYIIFFVFLLWEVPW